MEATQVRFSTLPWLQQILKVPSHVVCRLGQGQRTFSHLTVSTISVTKVSVLKRELTPLVNEMMGSNAAYKHGLRMVEWPGLAVWHGSGVIFVVAQTCEASG